LIPREWKTTQALRDTKKQGFVFRPPKRVRQFPMFNGSQNNPNNKKRPITLPGVDKGFDKGIK